MPNYDIHPFMKSFVGSAYDSYMPPQMLTWKEKHKNPDEHGISAWMKANMDSAETIARFQYSQNEKLVENEKLVNGEMVSSVNPEDMCEDCQEDFSDVLYRLQSEGTLPRIIKNYDMIGIPIKQQITEFAMRPDTISIEGYGEPLENDRYTVQKDFLLKTALEQLDIFFNQFLVSKGIDRNQVLDSEEEQAEFEQYVEQLKQERTPEEIGKYMKYDYKHCFEEWAMYEYKDQLQRFQLKSLQRKEFGNYIIAGRRFRLIDVTSDGLNISPLNYKNVYFQKNQNVPYVQNGDYVGTIELESGTSIINKYGQFLTEEQIKSLDSFSSYWEDKPARPQTDFFGNKVDYLDPDGNPYNQYLPSTSPFLNRLAPNLGVNWVSPLSVLFNEDVRVDQYYVITHYWRSMTRIGRLCWVNPESEMLEVIEVDESFVVPPYIKVLKKASFKDPVEPNTIVWAWVEELWKGRKVSRYNLTTDFGGLYFDIGPLEYQGNRYVYKNKPLPIVGQENSSPNLRHSTQVEIFKPYAFMYNLAMNKAYKMLELSYAAFLAMDFRNIPNQKDWGGEDGFFKWIESAQETLIGPVDTSPSAMQGANANGIYPRIIDIDNTNKALAAFNIASQIRQVALAQVGFTPQRLGQMSGINTATGVTEGLQQSYSATESWFTEFWEAEVPIIQQQLETAQWLQSKNKDFTALLSKGIISETVLTTNFDDFDLFSLRIYVSNSQEEVRQRELIERLAMDNTTDAPMSTRLEMLGMNNAQVVLNIVKEEEAKSLQRQQEAQRIQTQLQQETNDIERQRLEQEQEQFYAKLENELQRAWIVSRGFMGEDSQDVDKSGIPDAFEFEKFSQKAGVDLSKLGLSRDKLNFERERESSRKMEKQQELNIEQQRVNQKAEEAKLRNLSAQYMDKGTFKGKKK